MRSIVALALCGLLPAQASAWGFEAHRAIADRAIELLPPAIRPLFDKRRAFVVERSIDPDLWRNAGWDEEPPHHFLDMDHPAFGAYPCWARASIRLRLPVVTLRRQASPTRSTVRSRRVRPSPVRADKKTTGA